ncbi:MAG: hypothetical protein WC082_12205 [Victivallales bacterium]
MICPYCDVEISESAVEAEDGYCPECGVFLSASSVFDDASDFEDEMDDMDDFEDEMSFDDGRDDFGYEGFEDDER